MKYIKPETKVYEIQVDSLICSSPPGHQPGHSNGNHKGWEHGNGEGYGWGNHHNEEP